jgi:hypothetical protein
VCDKRLATIDFPRATCAASIDPACDVLVADEPPPAGCNRPWFDANAPDYNPEVRHPLREEFPREGFVQRAVEAHFAGWERDETTTADFYASTRTAASPG